MTIPKIKERRAWYPDSVREMCIREKYCTRMNTTEYAEMLESIETLDPTTENIYKIAKQIAEKSDIENYGVTMIEFIQGIMFQLAHDSIYTFFEIEGDE